MGGRQKPANASPPGRARRSSATPLVLGLAVMAFAIAFPLALTYFQAPEFFSCEEGISFSCVTRRMLELGPWGILISILAMTLAALTVFPSEVAAMANGAVYGVVWGSLLTWVSAMIGANIAFAAARAIGPHAIGLLLSEDHYERLCAWTARRGSLALLVARLIPLFPFFAVNYAAGLIGMRWLSFNLISGVGMAPAAVTFSTMGAKAGNMSWLHWSAMVLGVILLLVLVARTVLHLFGRARETGQGGSG
jgi:uncharacterized membrane protein YdjX (TVP38/TMEM64 family)